MNTLDMDTVVTKDSLPSIRYPYNQISGESFNGQDNPEIKISDLNEKFGATGQSKDSKVVRDKSLAKIERKKIDDMRNHQKPMQKTDIFVNLPKLTKDQKEKYLQREFCVNLSKKLFPVSDLLQNFEHKQLQQPSHVIPSSDH